jgi:hypothetical protein
LIELIWISGLPMKIGPPRNSCWMIGVSSLNVGRAIVSLKAPRSVTFLQGLYSSANDGRTSPCEKLTSASPGLSWVGATLPGGNHIASASGSFTIPISVDSNRTPPIVRSAFEIGMSSIA